MVAPYLRPDGDLSPEEQRAGLAALAGPLRAPFGQQRLLTIPAGKSMADLAVQNGGSQFPLYVELRQITGGAVVLLVGSNPTLAINMNASYAPIINVPIPFLLLPGEEIWIQGGPGGIAFTLLVTSVTV